MARHNLGKKIDANGTLNDLGNTVSDDDLTKISSIPYKLDKTTYEFNKELAIGSTGKVLVGKFPMYDSNVTISVSSTTNTTFYGTLVIATQNINDSHGGTYVANVYNDPTGTLSSSFVVKYPTNSRIFEVYCNFPSWSKNLIHIQAVALKAEPTNIVELITTDIPTDSLVTVNNVIDSTLSSKYLSFDGGTLNYQGQIKAGTSVFKDLYVEAENLRVLNPKNEDTTPTKIATIDSTGYIKYRTPSEIKSDMVVEIGAAGKLGVDTAIGDSPTNAKLPTSLAVANYLESKGLVTPSDLENTYMKKASPTGTGSLSLNRKANTTVGTNSVALGLSPTASGNYSFSVGIDTVASGFSSFAQGDGSQAQGSSSAAIGLDAIAKGDCSQAIGYGVESTHLGQHVFGAFNVLDTSTAAKSSQGTYIEIVGNGNKVLSTGVITRSNARTLDWEGNEVLSGTVTASGFKIPNGSSTQLLSASGGISTIGNINDIHKIYQGSCASAASASYKDVTVSSDFSLKDGVMLDVKFTNANTSTSPAIRINNVAKDLRYLSSSGNAYPTGASGWQNGYWAAGHTVRMMYSSTYSCWIMKENLTMGYSYSNSIRSAVADNSSKLNNQDASYYLNYNNLTNKPDAVDTSTFMVNSNPTGAGSFSLNRKSGTTIGDYSFTTGNNCTASGSHSFAGGNASTASGNYSVAIGDQCTANSSASHAEGYITHAYANGTHSEGYMTEASGLGSHSEGRDTFAKGYYSHAGGYKNTATHKSQYVFGEFNVLDTSTNGISDRGNYVEIVGNGTAESSRSNARTLDWSGNEWLAGNLTVVGNISAANMLTINKIYPVGSVYMSVNNTSPASFIGGTWEQLPAGYALWTATSGAGETISAGLPNITGSFGGNQDQGPSGAFYASSTGVKNSGSSKYGNIVQLNASRSSGIYGASSTVQPPAYKIYAWKRTA